MTDFPKYHSIEALSRKADILAYNCIVTEKLHGSSWRGSVSAEGDITIGSRNKVCFSNGEQHQKHLGSIPWFLDQKETIAIMSSMFPDYVFYGEWAGQGIQKGVSYSTGKDLYIYDIKDQNGIYLNWDDVVTATEKVGLKNPPELMRGKITIEELNDTLDQVSTLGKQNGFEDPDNIQEGFVIKPLKVMYDHRGDRLIAKYKSGKWAEKASASKVPKNIDPEQIALRDKAAEYATTIVTLGRVSTVIDHIVRDSGEGDVSMKRTGEFLKEMLIDVEKDEKEFFETLEKKERKTYIKAISQLAAKEFKNYILTCRLK